MLSFDAIIRVRYADTDQMGYVYYGNYLTFYEIGRVELLRKLGIRYKELEKSGIIMPVIESHSKYILPAQYDELLTIRTTIEKIPLLKIVFYYKIFNEEKKIIHTGKTILAFINTSSKKPCSAPKSIISLLEKHITP